MQKRDLKRECRIRTAVIAVCGAALVAGVSCSMRPAAVPVAVPSPVASDCGVDFTPYQQDSEILARLIYSEARGCSKEQQAAVVWCVLNRVDSPEFPGSVYDVVTQRGQFAYNASAPVCPQFKAIAEDVMARWVAEPDCTGSVGRILPQEYLFFTGDGEENHFVRQWMDDTDEWDWSLPSPYREESNQ